MDLTTVKVVYFVGIGGIGMSALARYFHLRGAEVHGYDLTVTPLTRELERMGMRIHYTEDLAQLPPQPDLVVYTPAIPADHAELRFFREQEAPLFKRAEVLGLISREMRCIAIAGTHGKTTTSSMVTHLLRQGGVDVTAFLGGISRNLESNFVHGTSDWVVVEADEFDRSFLQLSPELAGILSIDPDHLDIYGDHEHMLTTGFLPFIDRIVAGGKLWINDKLRDKLPLDRAFATYGVGTGDSRAWNVRVEAGDFVFDYEDGGVRLEGLHLPMPGRHNVENATLAIAIARSLGVSPDRIRTGLASFAGIKRRFERIWRNDLAAYYDDYAHHPTEIRAAINAARELYPGRKLTGIFQPHLFSRTRDFADGFAAALDELDELLLLEIYPAREKPIPGVDARMLLDRMQLPARRLTTKPEVLAFLHENDVEVLLTLGAGNIDTLVEPIRQLLKEKYPG